jgi:RNA polymerase sigma-70 factor, ECF subfamily
MTLEFLQPKAGDARPQECSAENASSDSASVVFVDNDLVRRFRHGDMGAFEELFSRHQKRVYNIALRMLGDETEAADATQEIFVRAYQSIGKLSSDAAFVTWLKTMAMNLCRDLLRKRGTMRVTSLDAPIATGDGKQMLAEIADFSGNPETLLGEKQMREVVTRAIDSLSPDYREVVTLFYVDGSDVAEVAKIVGSPVGTVKSRLSRARAELRRKLEHYVKD